MDIIVYSHMGERATQMYDLIMRFIMTTKKKARGNEKVKKEKTNLTTVKLTNFVVFDLLS